VRGNTKNDTTINMFVSGKEQNTTGKKHH